MPVVKKEFLHAYQTLLDGDKDSLDMEIKQQIVYFADNQELYFYKKKQLMIRYRWSNKWLEVVVKKRWISKSDYKKLEHHFAELVDHQLKVEVDQISHDSKTLSCTLRHVFNSMHQSFAFYNDPADLLSEEQKRFLGFFTEKEVKSLHFLIPIQSKTFIFPSEFKEFDSISLEEWRMPKLFGSRFYEFTAKTTSYDKKTVDHFLSLCENLDITVHKGGMYKTQWLYDSYFNV